MRYLSGKARLAGVMGWPVSHSRSPRLHGHWLAELEIDGAYLPLPVAPDHFAEALAALPKLGFAGVNVTVPHKEAAYAAVDVRDAVAERLKAVNTIVVLPDGRLEGRNTDGYGFMANLRDQAPDWQAAAGPAVVLGAGGAARAVVAALLDAGAPEVRLINRTLEKATAMAADLGGAIRPMGWQEVPQALSGANLLVNTTSLGMAGQPPLEIALTPLPRTALVTDIVYVPLRTPLLDLADAQGFRTVDGLGMLLWQAQPGFEAWFGHRPAVTEELRRVVLGA